MSLNRKMALDYALMLEKEIKKECLLKNIIVSYANDNGIEYKDDCVAYLYGELKSFRSIHISMGIWFNKGSPHGPGIYYNWRVKKHDHSGDTFQSHSDPDSFKKVIEWIKEVEAKQTPS